EGLIMTTEAQIIANRRNARKSTGPRTNEGKNNISQNALKHGFYASQAEISSENKEEFCLYRDWMLAELAPVGRMESMLAQRIVSLSWRLKRADIMQNQTINAMKADNKSNPLAKLTYSLLFKNNSQPQPDSSKPAEDLTLGRLAIKDFSNARVLERLLMYERRLEHSLYKTIYELQNLKLIRQLDHDSD
ncbi:MAG: hypothetical protein RQ760_16695, partial [Sedimentisphaerales bacterium]|nr:hypothetical protein [Sedimentisphaerales bacterium]